MQGAPLARCFRALSLQTSNKNDYLRNFNPYCEEFRSNLRSDNHGAFFIFEGQAKVLFHMKQWKFLSLWKALFYNPFLCLGKADRRRHLPSIGRRTKIDASLSLPLAERSRQSVSTQILVFMPPDC